MLELARGTSQWAHKFKHAIIFLFNTGEEEGLNGAHSFITQVALVMRIFPWKRKLCMVFFIPRISYLSIPTAFRREKLTTKFKQVLEVHVLYDELE